MAMKINKRNYYNCTKKIRAKLVLMLEKIKMCKGSLYLRTLKFQYKN